MPVAVAAVAAIGSIGNRLVTAGRVGGWVVASATACALLHHVPEAVEGEWRWRGRASTTTTFPLGLLCFGKVRVEVALCSAMREACVG